jgi:hypothetical protein
VRRVLAPGGRLALSVWQGIERHPFYRTLDRAIERHLGTSAVGEVFSLGDAGALRGLLNEAGFTDVHVSPFSFIARFPQPDTFVAGEIDVLTAAIPAMQRLDVHARRALASAIADEMAAALQSVTVNDQVHLPFHGQIATAT